MSSNTYIIDFRKLALQLIPMALRRPILISLLSVSCTAISQIWAAFTRFRTTKKEELKYNGQTCRLEYCLNSKLDTTERRIRVTDGNTEHGTPYWVYARNTAYYNNKLPLMRGVDGRHVILNRRDVNAEKIYHFYIVAPQAAAIDLKRLKPIVNKYKLQSKTWELISQETYEKRKLY